VSIDSNWTVSDREVLEVAEERRSNNAIYAVWGGAATLDQLLDFFITFYEGSHGNQELWTQAVEMQNLRARARTRGQRPPAPMQWLPAISAIQDKVE